MEYWTQGPCHIRTIGKNYVIQIIGRKPPMWNLLATIIEMVPWFIAFKFRHLQPFQPILTCKFAASSSTINLGEHFGICPHCNGILLCLANTFTTATNSFANGKGLANFDILLPLFLSALKFLPNRFYNPPIKRFLLIILPIELA